jgi:NAD(P)-dependent dehydrogenase (short-subunit alcohol dehydrogenase family)
MSVRTAFITGAATGIGKALIEKLDREGWRCFSGYNRQPPDALLAACSDRTTAVPCNVTDDASVTSALEDIGRAIGEGSLDLLVNNAATTGGAGGGVENVDIDRFKALFEVNFWGPIRVAQAALPFIRRSEQEELCFYFVGHRLSLLRARSPVRWNRNRLASLCIERGVDDLELAGDLFVSVNDLVEGDRLVGDLPATSR